MSTSRKLGTIFAQLLLYYLSFPFKVKRGACSHFFARVKFYSPPQVLTWSNSQLQATLQLTTDRTPHCSKHVSSAPRQTSYKKGLISTSRRLGTIFAQLLLYCPSLPFEVKSQAYFWSATKSLHVQRVASYQNCGQHSRQLGPLAQTLWDIAFSLQPRPPQGSVCINDLTTKAWGDGTGPPFWLTQPLFPLLLA